MGKLTVLALRIVLATVLAGTLYVQAVMVPLLDIDLQEAGADLATVRVPIATIIVLGIVTIQVTLVCVWRLLTMVRRGTVFSHAAFKYVHIVIGAAAAASLLTFGLAVTLAPTAVPPGFVLLICGAAVMVAGIALLVLVLRMLLAQAVARDADAHHLQAELDEVI
ncbi:DUF2975 domain-containing protein [Qaidamihabitans albus]|uniref:DUF2975 domain-containing protein n=1 Tax=Qaidamihabitans albus TaxID=2795733 RepID=UPI0018F1CBDC|nr:DUF2975 domain-containing protein [Qaidamihabitans albus]